MKTRFGSDSDPHAAKADFQAGDIGNGFEDDLAQLGEVAGAVVFEDDDAIGAGVWRNRSANSDKKGTPPPRAARDRQT